MADVLIYKLAQDIIAACDLVLMNSTIFDQRKGGSVLIPSKLIGNSNITKDEPLLTLFGADPTFSRQWLHPSYDQILNKPWTYVNTSIAFYSPSTLFTEIVKVTGSNLTGAPDSEKKNIDQGLVSHRDFT